MQYDRFQYLRPPRPGPDSLVPPSLFAHRESIHWAAQAKMNGTNSVIFVPPDREVYAWNRHSEPHRAWAFTEESAEPFRAVPGNGWWVFNAELLHSKGPTVKDTNYVHDVLVADGELLLGRTYRHRYELLHNLFYKPGCRPFFVSHWEVAPKLWLARLFLDDFSERLAGMNEPYHEGLVFKDPEGLLTSRDVSPGDHSSTWLAKYRKPTRVVKRF